MHKQNLKNICVKIKFGLKNVSGRLLDVMYQSYRLNNCAGLYSVVYGLER